MQRISAPRPRSTWISSSGSRSSRGPSSSLYGTNAFLAVVNIVTRSGNNLKGAELSAEAASFHTSKGRASYGNSFGNGVELLAVRIDLSQPRPGPLLRRVTIPRPARTGWPRAPMGTITGTPSPRLRWAASPSKGSSRRGRRASRQAHTERPSGIPARGPATAAGRVILGFERELDDRCRSPRTSPTTPTATRATTPTPPASSRTTALPTGGRSRPRPSAAPPQADDRRRVRVQEEPAPGPERLGRRSLQALPAGSSADSSSWAVFLQDEWRVLPDLIVTGGVRYDNYDSFGGTVNPRLAIIWARRSRRR